MIFFRWPVLSTNYNVKILRFYVFCWSNLDSCVKPTDTSRCACFGISSFIQCNLRCEFLFFDKSRSLSTKRKALYIKMYKDLNYGNHAYGQACSTACWLEHRISPMPLCSLAAPFDSRTSRDYNYTSHMIE